MTDHRALLGLLGEWVTVTHPSDRQRVWHGQLASLMDCPSIVLQMPEGGTEVLPQSFDVHGAAPATGGPHPDVDSDARPFAALRDSGLLWLINRVALHPRGLALALHLDEHGQAYGWSLVSNGEGEPWMFDPATDNDGFVRAEATIAKALGREDDRPRCCVCGGRPVVYENYRDQPFCAGCANCDCGQDLCVRTRPDARPDTDADASGRVRPPILGTAPTSTDTGWTPHPDTASGRPDDALWEGQRKGCGDLRCNDPRCREEAVLAQAREYVAAHPELAARGSRPDLAEARERIATAMELPLDLLAPPRCDCGQTGPLVGEATNGWHFHISPEDHERLTRERDDSFARTAWGKCWDRAEALRADLQRAAAAYDALRTRVITTSKYVAQQQRSSFPLRGGENRYRVLDTLAMWTEDPGPLKLASLTPDEEP
ncbi:hypothetical protein ASD08_30880 [Streptomyces sp. Root369]|nr:hypothetical protein ASD08_30880 [Streptomyces sp. Root369]